MRKTKREADIQRPTCGKTYLQISAVRERGKNSQMNNNNTLRNNNNQMRNNTKNVDYYERVNSLLDSEDFHIDEFLKIYKC